MANMCSMCGGTSQSKNYAKLIDPPIQPYGTILGDSSQNSFVRRPQMGQMSCVHMCLPTVTGGVPPMTGRGGLGGCPGVQSSVIQVPCDPVKPCPKFICEPCPPPPPTKIWLIKSSPMPQKSACLPVGGCSHQSSACPSPAKVLVCLPCPPPMCAPMRSENTNQNCPFPFGVPQKVDGERNNIRGGKYLPPPERRICSPCCIHASDIKGIKECTWYKKIPCIAHCYDTPLRPS